MIHRNSERQLERSLINDEAINNALSRKGNFVSITITVVALSQEQLDDIYRDVSSHEDVLMAL